MWYDVCRFSVYYFVLLLWICKIDMGYYYGGGLVIEVGYYEQILTFTWVTISYGLVFEVGLLIQ